MTFEKQKHKTTTTACDKFCKEAGDLTACKLRGSLGSGSQATPICQYNQGNCVAVQFNNAIDAEAAEEQCNVSGAELSEAVEEAEAKAKL